MSQVTVTVEFDQVAGTVKFTFDLQGATELDHELLAATIGTGRSVSLKPTHVGNELFAEFTITDPAIWPKAARALANRKRVADGLPTIEQEEERAKMAKAAAEKADADAKDAQAKQDKEVQDRQDAADAHTAKVVADTLKTLGAK